MALYSVYEDDHSKLRVENMWGKMGVPQENLCYAALSTTNPTFIKQASNWHQTYKVYASFNIIIY